MKQKKTQDKNQNSNMKVKEIKQILDDEIVKQMNS